MDIQYTENNIVLINSNKQKIKVTNSEFELEENERLEDIKNKICNIHILYSYDNIDPHLDLKEQTIKLCKEYTSMLIKDITWHACKIKYIDFSMHTINDSYIDLEVRYLANYANIEFNSLNDIDFKLIRQMNNKNKMIGALSNVI
jgi:hypothetical protein